VTKVITRAKSLGQRLRNRLFGYLPNRRGNVAPLIAVMMVPMLGVLGLAAEGSNWMFTHRATQNAADSAVVGAANAYESYSACSASSGTNCTDSGQNEGKAIATNFGFTDGVKNANVTINELVACPANVSASLTAALGANSCFTAVVKQKMPLLLLNAFGFGGNTTISGAKGVQVASTAIAGPVGVQVPVCVLGLSPSGPPKGNSDTIQLNGNPDADLGACTIFSDGKATCNGGNSGAFIGGAAKKDNGCGVAEFSNQNTVADPYSSASSHGTIPGNPCSGSNPVTIAGGSYDATTLASKIGNATSDTSGMKYGIVCGALSLGGDVTLTGGDLGIVIESGDIEFNGHTLSTLGTPGSAPGMTLIYQGTGTGAFNVTNSNGGTLNISNPTDLTGTSTWNGFTIYDPADSGSMTYAGNQPAWDLTGIVYFPNVDMDWRGIIGKANSGYECFDFVVNSLLIDGTAKMFAPNLNNPSSQCGLDNVKPPTVLGYRYALVG
jgi:Flp pilus assembly protein TadG